ncbi:MAG TPA: ribose-5-phosphate isomerase RpiA [Ohtaekwangia sp.]|nr:ribose-5-phosphate isomerase RpiA [Ohtaekwangia sp.]
MNAKQSAAEKAVTFLRDGMTVGLGTGSTANHAITAIANMVKEGLRIKGVATSTATEKLARALNIPLLSIDAAPAIDLAIDGADEVDANNNLIKGGGGALLREKLIAFNSKSFIVIVDASKRVDNLGRFPLPVEMIAFGATYTLAQLQRMGCSPTVRQSNGKTFVTENGNLIADCRFHEPILNPAALAARLKTIPGIVETGLFPGSMVKLVVVGYDDGHVQLF